MTRVIVVKDSIVFFFTRLKVLSYLIEVLTSNR